LGRLPSNLSHILAPTRRPERIGATKCRIDRIPARSGYVEQETAADDAKVFVEVDNIRVSGSTLHRPEVMADECGPQGVEREQKRQRARPGAEGAFSCRGDGRNEGGATILPLPQD